MGGVQGARQGPLSRPTAMSCPQGLFVGQPLPLGHAQAYRDGTHVLTLSPLHRQKREERAEEADMCL